jgi:hypothetical protein
MRKQCFLLVIPKKEGSMIFSVGGLWMQASFPLVCFPPFLLKEKVEPKVQGKSKRSAAFSWASAQQAFLIGFLLYFVYSLSL